MCASPAARQRARDGRRCISHSAALVEILRGRCPGCITPDRTARGRALPVRRGGWSEAAAPLE